VYRSIEVLGTEDAFLAGKFPPRPSRSRNSSAFQLLKGPEGSGKDLLGCARFVFQNSEPRKM
jgi:hypothetical protein